MQDNKNLQIKVLVNDKPVAMNPFVQDIVKNVVYALVQSLKLENQPEKIAITLEKS
jgi:hypothetical protein